MRLRLLTPALPAALAVALALVAAPAPAAQEAGEATVVDGFAHPESALWHNASEAWYVSNFGDAFNSTATDCDGFISRLTPDGDLDRAWVGGDAEACVLHSPGGLAAHHGTLYVADVAEDGEGAAGGRLVAINVTNATVEAEVPLPNATFPNDVAAATNGTVYVSDTAANRVYAWRPGEDAARVLLESHRLEAPNGLLATNESLVVASVGPGLDPATFETVGPGRLFEVDLGTLNVTALTGPLGSMDGVVRADGAYLANAANGTVYRVDAETGAVGVALTVEGGAADIGYRADAGILAAPQLADGVVVFRPVPTTGPEA